MKKISLAITLIFAMVLSGCSGLTVKSPDKNVSIVFSSSEEGPAYQIFYKGEPMVLPSTLGFKMPEGDFGPGVSFGHVSSSSGVESYDLVVGKCKHVDAKYRQAIIPLVEKEGLKRTINLVVRAFNDGVAFRYEFPDGSDSLLISNERMDVNFAVEPTATVLPLPSYQSCHEGLYTVAPVSELPENTIFDLPATFEFPNGNVLAFTEANMSDYPGMILMKTDGTLSSRLSPRLDRPELAVIAAKPHKTPWRVFMVSDNIGNLIASNIITSLAEPCKIEDTSWIKPGKTTLPWWCDSACKDDSCQAGNNFWTNKQFVDFAAEAGFQYHEVYGFGYDSWYCKDGAGLAGTNFSTANAINPVPTLDIPQLMDYAKTKNVGIFVWVHWNDLWQDIDNVLSTYEKWGVKGMMCDFMDRDDQEMIFIQEEILRKSAEHHILVQFHGASKPSGLSRTYPNELTREGTYNLERLKFEKGLTTEQNLSVACSRVLAGPADYHMGGFLSVTREEFQPNYHEPKIPFTRCHMLALYVVLESYLSELCDSPLSYEGQPGLEFACEVPTVWDETVPVSAKMGHHVAMARRNGDTWWLGAICGQGGADLNVGLDFLGDGEWTAEIYSDTEETKTDAKVLAKDTRDLKSSDKLDLKLIRDGGCAIKFVKKN